VPRYYEVPLPPSNVDAACGKHVAMMLDASYLRLHHASSPESIFHFVTSATASRSTAEELPGEGDSRGGIRACCTGAERGSLGGWDWLWTPGGRARSKR